MILRKVTSGLVVVSQTDHAWASGEAARALSDRFTSEAWRGEIMRLVSHHDDGWEEWESNAARSNELPPNFDQLKAEEHHAIWMRGVETVYRHLGPFSAAVLAKHAQSLGEKAASEQLEALARCATEYAREAFPGDDPAVREWELERAFQVLQFCDVLTLMPCAGWSEPMGIALLDEDGRHVEVAIRPTGKWELAVDPWPFDPAALEVRIPVTRLADASEWPHRAEAFLAGKRETELLHILPLAALDPK